MNENVKAFLDKKKEEERAKQEKERNKVLIDLGLYEKEYSESDSYSNEYPLSEWDSVTQTNVYYRNVPYEVTDEEYEQIKKYAAKNDNESDECTNVVVNVLSVIAWIIYIGGLITGCVLAGDGYDFKWSVAWLYWCAAIISGTMFLGFAEIIKLLEAIKNK